MSRNEKIIVSLLAISTVVFLLASIFLLFRSRMAPVPSKNATDVSITPTKSVKVVYPSIPPIENMTVMMNERRFSPDSFTIPKGGFVDFLNIGTENITIEAADSLSSALSIGVVGPSETKRVVMNVVGRFTYQSKGNPKQIGIIIVK